MSKNRLVRLLGLGVALLAAPAIASAVVLNFTFNGTANEATNGYTIGQAVSFTFTPKSSGPMTPNGSATAGATYRWIDENSQTDPDLFASVSGTGLSGTWTRPATNNNSPWSNLSAFATGQLIFFAATESVDDTGLSANGQAFNQLNLDATFTGLGVLFDPITGTLPDPTDYFGANLIGTYAVASQSAPYLATLGSFTNFTLTSLTISAVPEPSSFAAIADAIALGGVLVRRRRRA